MLRCNHLGGPLARLNPCGYQLSSVAELLHVRTAVKQLVHDTVFCADSYELDVFSTFSAPPLESLEPAELAESAELPEAAESAELSELPV